MADIQTVEDLGAKVKAKYPGSYDDLSNAELGAKIKAKFPGSYDDFVDAPAASPKPDAFQAKVQQFREDHPIASQLALAVPDALGGIGSGVISTGVGAYNLARNWIPGADKALPAVSPEIQKLTEAPPSIVGHVGKFAEQAGEFLLPVGEAVKGAQVVSKALEARPLVAALTKLGAESAAAGGVSAVQSGGDPNAIALGAGGTALIGGGMMAIPAGARAAVARALSNAARPLSDGAIALADRYGIPLNQGDLSGSKFVQGVQKVLSSTVAPDLFEAQGAQAQQGVNGAVNDLTGGFAADKYIAGQNTLDHLLGAAGQHEATAQAEYANLKALEAHPDNQVSVQVGTKTVPQSSLLDASGAPASGARTVPVMQDIGLPVDMRDTKQLLAPLEKEISMRMPPAQQRADPGLTAIRNILTRPDYLPASVAEADLGYLKDILRSPAPGQAKRLAGIAIDSLDQGVKDAVSKAGPDALDSLSNARSSWAQRSQILDTVKDLANDSTGQSGQVLTATKLLQPADASFPALQKVLQAAPEAAPQLGQAYLTERVFKSAADGSDFTTPKQARNLWNQIGPRTKAALYTPDQIADVNDFLELTKRLSENPNPSGTGYINGILKMVGLITHPVGGGAAIAVGRRAATWLLNPQRAAVLRTALEGEGTAAGAKAVQSLEDMRTGKPPEPAQPKMSQQQQAQQQQAAAAPAISPQQAKPPALLAQPAKLAIPDTPEELAGNQSSLTPPAATLGKDQLKPATPSGIVSMDPREIKADPVRFQFKRDTGGASGTGDELKAVKKYDPELGGVLSVWKDPADGQTYVVNGHHRLELATRAGAPSVDARYLDAATANEARTKGALINMAEGRGTAIDAAKVLRDEQITPEQLADKGVSLKGAVARDGANLSKLSPELFDQVVSGDLPVQRASLIGEKLPNHADQAAALQMVDRAEGGGKKVSNDVFRELIDMVQGAPKKDSAANENLNLFGDVEPQQESTALEMAGLSDYVRKKLMTEKKLFGTVSDAGKSKLLQDAGTQLVGDKNGQMAEGAAQALAAYDKLKALSGPVNDALRNGAASLGKRGAPANEIRTHAYERIRKAIGDMGIGGDAGGGIDFNRLPKDPLPYVPRNPRPRRVNIEPWEQAEPHAPAYLANSHAVDYVTRSILGAPQDVGLFGALRIQPSAVSKALAVLQSKFGPAVSELPGMGKLIAALKDAEGKSMVLLHDTPDRSEGFLRRGANEEYDHIAQSQLLDGETVKGHVDAKQLLSHPAAAKAVEALRSMRYGSDPDTLAAEIGVRLMRPGLAETELGLRPSESDSLAKFYSSLLEQQHGERSLSIRKQIQAARK